jgi:uncharacterized protein (TIGR01777 family)
MKKILLAGGTGLIGSYLIKELLNRGDEVTLISRNAGSAVNKYGGRVKAIDWNNLDKLKDEPIDVIINLSGMNLDEKRWNEKVKKEIYDSRILTTRRLAELACSQSNKPNVLINSSGVDIYGDTGEKDIYEDSPPGSGFLQHVVIDWEKEALNAGKCSVRVVILRTGFVIAKGSKALNKMAMPFRFFAGGPAGNGKQYMSWIHIKDLVRIYLTAIDNKNMDGIYNAASPNPERMKLFSKHLGKVLHRPSFFPAPAFLIRLLFGEVAEVIVSGRKALPGKLKEEDFKFEFENAEDALREALG